MGDREVGVRLRGAMKEQNHPIELEREKERRKEEESQQLWGSERRQIFQTRRGVYVCFLVN